MARSGAGSTKKGSAKKGQTTAPAQTPVQTRRRHVERGRYSNAPVDRAAGGVVCHEGAVLVVHRPRYDDWSLPKGHLNRGESWEQAALREVLEETGVRCAITSGPFPVSYLTANGVPKLVLFYAMAPKKVPKRLVGDPSEVDEVAWWEIADAVRALSYDAEREACSALTIGHLRRRSSAAG